MSLTASRVRRATLIVSEWTGTRHTARTPPHDNTREPPRKPRGSERVRTTEHYSHRKTSSTRDLFLIMASASAAVVLAVSLQ